VANRTANTIKIIFKGSLGNVISGGKLFFITFKEAGGNSSAFYLGFARESVKSRFLILNVSAGNITLCRIPHVARELRVDRACHGEWSLVDMSCNCALVSPIFRFREQKSTSRRCRSFGTRGQ
jgi:hypothetical protein